VTCASASGCWAVGYFHTGTVYQTLVMHYPAPVALVSAASKRTHGSAGTFEIDLPLIGNPGIACPQRRRRAITLVFSFANTLTSVASSSITSDAGSVSSSNIDSNDTHSYIVNLTG
jgi:hypothetical protein